MKYLIAILAALVLTGCGKEVSETDDFEYEPPSEEEVTQQWTDSVKAFPVTFPDGTVVNCVIYPGVAMECFE